MAVLLEEEMALGQITAIQLDEARETWTRIAGEDEFASECAALFDWAEHHLDYSKHAEACAYAIVNKSDNTILALAEIIQSRRGGGLSKLLRVLISPQFWDVTASRDTIVHIYSNAILGTIKVAASNGARNIKLYGRSEQLLSILCSLHVRLSDKKVPGLKTEIQGRWLVLQLS